MPQPASALTAAVLSLSRFLSTQTSLVVVTLVSLATVGTWWWRSGRLARFALAVSESTPAIRARTDEFRRTKLFQALALMIRGGYTLDDAMARCTQLGLGRRMSNAIESARRQVLAGVAPADAFSAAQLLDEVSLRLMRVGERSGHFDRVLTTIAERHAQRFGTTVERVTRIAEPLMLLLVALAVGTLVVLMYIPVFDIAGSVR
jgi:general secretion pathway protein F